MHLRDKLALLVVMILLASHCVSQAQDQSEVKPRRMITKVVPIYPGLAQKMSISGAVRIEGVVAPNGTAKSAQVLGGHPVLAQAAIDAFRSCKWEAAAHETKETIVFNFHPQ
jgi:TonB family protein